MQFSTAFIAAFAALAYAGPAEKRSTRVPGQVDISLPPGCTKGDLASKSFVEVSPLEDSRAYAPAITECAIHLIGTGASCGAAVIEAGANPAADLACVGSAAGTAASIDDCKNCIPKNTNAKEDIVVKRESREVGQVDVTLPPGCTKKDLAGK